MSTNSKLTVEFNAADHTYKLNGTPVPSVTHVLRDMGLCPQFAGEAAIAAASRGTRVHKMCEDLDWGCEVYADAECKPFVLAYKKFLVEKKPVWHTMERIVANTDYMYAGRLDRVGVVGGAMCVVDIKTGTTQGPWHGLQLAAYTLCLRIAEPVKRTVVQLFPTGEYVLRYYDNEYDFALWRSAVSLWWWRNKNKLVSLRSNSAGKKQKGGEDEERYS